MALFVGFPISSDSRQTLVLFKERASSGAGPNSEKLFSD